MTEQVRRYVAGFLFRENSVLLVQKTHPRWQVGLWNGIGGEIEGSETSREAMVREFHEEAKYHTDAWEYFANERGPGYSVFFFRYRLPEGSKYEPPEENDKGELLEWYRCSRYDVLSDVIGNLRWLIPMALDPRPIECTVETTGDIRSIKTW